MWVSEIMLQQTQVKTVIDYYNRWMARWPTVQDLACASIDEVNEVWAGLGYYRRAKLLHDGAKKVVNDLGGHLPRTAAELAKLPGIGPYTAGAIASIAYGENAPIVDGNIIRVLSRLRLLSADPKQRETVKIHWKLAESLVACGQQPHIFNQALMELGALVCTPKQPVMCSGCPLREECLAYAEFSKETALIASGSEDPEYPSCQCCDRDYRNSFGEDSFAVTRYPQSTAMRAPKQKTTWVVLLHNSQGSVLCVKRPEGGLLGGLWEFPQVDVESTAEETPTARPRALDKLLRDKQGVDLDVVEHSRSFCGELVHLFTHIRQTLLVETIQLNGHVACTGSSTSRWVNENELASTALSKGMIKCLQLVQKQKASSDRAKPAKRPRTR